MNTRHMIDPELVPGLEYFPDLNLEAVDIPALRAASIEALPPEESYAREDVAIEHVRIPGMGNAPEIAAIIYRPRSQTGRSPCLLNIHGGGYLFGSAADMGAANVRTAAEVGCVVVSPEYRLAPETKAPGPLEDCYAVLSWISANADSLNIDPQRLAVGGMSAGAGLAAAVALLARDQGEIPLCFQMLIYPMIDDRTAIRPLAEDNPHTGEFVWTREANRIAWASYLGMEPGVNSVSQYAAPARASDLSGLPPAYVAVGALDLFLEENLDYAHRLLRAGVPTELHVLPGAYHGFELAAQAQLARDSESERRAALARAFSR